MVILIQPNYALLLASKYQFGTWFGINLFQIEMMTGVLTDYTLRYVPIMLLNCIWKRQWKKLFKNSPMLPEKLH